MGIFESLMSAYIKAPTGSQLEGVKENFIMKWGVPQCVGQLMAVLSPSLPLSVTILTTITVRDFTQYFYKVLLMLTIIVWTYVWGLGALGT